MELETIDSGIGSGTWDMHNSSAYYANGGEQ